jgi:hypothetical protein
MWFINTGIFYTVSLLFDGKGDFRTLLRYIGCGYVPIVVSAVLVSVTIYYLAHRTPPPESVSGIVAFQRGLQSSPTYVGIKLIAIVFEVWRGFLWIVAVEHARDVNRKQAALTVGIPVVLSVSWKLGKVAGLL